MPTYFYTAVSSKGDRISGTEEAKSERDLAQELHKRGFVLTLAHGVGDAPKRAGFQDIQSALFGVSLEEKMMFVRNLQVMVGAGVAIPKALDVLSSQSRSKIFQKTIVSMKEQVLKGQAFSDAIASFPQIFSELFVNMVKVGEESGTLEQVLSTLTLQLEREHDMKSKVQGALLYPSVILSAMLGIGILMLIFVVPTLASTFKDLGVELPPMTEATINLGTLLSRFWYLLPFFFLALFLAGFFALRSSRIKLFLDVVLLKAPLFSKLVRQSNTASFARTLSSLISSGVPIVRSLEITSKVLSNSSFRNAVASSSEEIRKGAKLSDILSKYSNLFPPITFQMLSVGEETGKTGEMLQKLAEFFEEELDTLTRNLSTIIEPLLMICMGAAVGFFAISVIQRMYSMLNKIQ